MDNLKYFLTSKSVRSNVFQFAFDHVELCDLFYAWFFIKVMHRWENMRHAWGLSHQINDVMYKEQLGPPTVCPPVRMQYLRFLTKTSQIEF